MKVGLLALVFLSLSAHGDSLVIQETEKLRNSLPLRDGSRKELTLRLADLYFDEAIGKGNGATIDEAIREHDQKRAVSLYQESLNGNDGVYAPVTGGVKRKVQFQLARLDADLGLADRAVSLWTELVTQSDLPDLQREAALRLAEVREKQDTARARGEADSLYQLAIRLCAGGDVCSYAHYRRAWLLKAAGEMPAALSQMQLALWDSKGQVREESLRDLVQFLSASPGDGKNAVETLEPLAAKLNRPSLLSDLSEGFYSVGNRAAGTFVLGYVNARSPRLAYQIRLLEEYYGARNWDKFRETLETARAATPVFVGKESLESEKVLRRLLIQLDGERISQTRYNPDFQQTTLLYLSLYPASSDRLKMVEGWLAAETDPSRKLAQLAAWIADPRWILTKDEVIHLREFRAATAAKNKVPAVVQDEMSKLAELTANPAKAREYNYVRANALFEMKSPEAVGAYQGLATAEAPFDTIRMNSQHTLLGLLAESKRYGELIAQADLWLNSTAAKKDTKIAGDLQRIRDVKEQAQFEQAVGGGKTAPALAMFQEFCEAKKFLPKSCENARVLSIELKNQPALFAVLKAQNRTEELQAEYEAAGYFAQSAAMAETHLTGADTTQQLKVALLYELGNKFTERDHLLRRLVASLKGRPTLGPAEDLLRQTLQDAGLLNLEALSLHWTPNNQAGIAELFKEKSLGNDNTKRILLSQTLSTGPAWSKRVLAEVERLDAAQKKIHFYGKRSTRQFEARIAAIKKLGKEVETYLNGADRALRVRLLGVLQRSQKDLAQEILATPIPEAVTGADAESVKASLAQLAAPYNEQAAKFEGTAREEIAKATDPAEKGNLENELVGHGVIASAPPTLAATTATSNKNTVGGPAVTAVDPAALLRAIDTLHGDPTAAPALLTIKNFYQEQGQNRLAAYFQGRLQHLGTPSAPKESTVQ